MKQQQGYWYEKLTSIVVFFIVLQTIAVFEDYWWPETFTLIYIVMSLALAVQLFFPWRWLKTKVILHWLLGLTTFWYVSGIQLLSPTKNYTTKEQFYWLLDQLRELYPFLLIAATVLFLYEFIIYMMYTRKRMIIVFVISMLTLTIMDSYTPIWLWDNIAIVVFVFLVWLAGHHLHDVHQRHPQRGKQLIGYPIRVVLPLLIVLGLVMMIGINVPAPAPFLQDPYTLWKQSKGESVHVFLGEKATGVDVNGTQLAATSGYGRDDSELGGGFLYDHSPVMSVETTQKSYLRGESKSFYNGQGWTDEFMESTSNFNWYKTVVPSDHALELGDWLPLGVTKQEVTQKVKWLQPELAPVLFAAAFPFHLMDIKMEAKDDQDVEVARANWLPELGELHWETPEASKVKEYSIVSQQLMVDETILQEKEALIKHAIIHDMYIQLPEELPERVRQLARDVTAEAKSDYERAKLLEAHLSTNYTYSNQPDLSKLTGESTDFVDQFLFEVQEGYCDYYSTAMVVLSRSLDMPARWVKGFTAGARSDLVPSVRPEVIDPSGAGTYTVRNSDAHSWVEIFFDDYGWVPFEPTAGFIYPHLASDTPELETPDSEMDKVEAEEEPVEKENTINANTSSGFTISSRVMMYVGIFLLLGIVVLLIWKRAILWGWLRAYRFKSLTNKERIELQMKWLLRYLKRHQLQIADNQSIREAITKWVADHKLEQTIEKAVLSLLQLFEEACYGKQPIGEEKIMQFEELDQQIRHYFAEKAKNK